MATDPPAKQVQPACRGAQQMSWTSCSCCSPPCHGVFLAEAVHLTCTTAARPSPEPGALGQPCAHRPLSGQTTLSLTPLSSQNSWQGSTPAGLPAAGAVSSWTASGGTPEEALHTSKSCFRHPRCCSLGPRLQISYNLLLHCNSVPRKPEV